MKLTVFEQGTLPIRAVSEEGRACLDPRQAQEVLDCTERMGVRAFSWHGPHALRVHQFVGAIGLDGLCMEILPKLEGLAEPAAVRRNLLAMLAVTHDLEVHASEQAGFLARSETLPAALARLYCRRLLDAVRRGLRQEYRLHHEPLPHLRGKVDWVRQVKLQAGQRLEFHCSFDERSEDTPLNRALKAALLAASGMLEGTRSAGMVTELRHALDLVATVRPSSEQIRGLRTDRTNHQLEPLLALARLILGGQSPDQLYDARWGSRTYALSWDMNVLFEEYIGRVTAQALEPLGWTVGRQRGGKHLAVEAQARKPAFLLRPDLLIHDGRRLTALADTKWKHLDPRDRDLGVAAPDVYQLLAYAHRYQVQRAFLIYPHHPALGLPGVKRRYELQGGIHLGILTLDLAHLDAIGPALRETLGP